MLYKGSKTGANALGYAKLKKGINSSDILQLERGNILCPRCLKELDEWIKAEGGPHRLAPLPSGVLTISKISKPK
jgi:hypothetical protein